MNENPQDIQLALEVGVGHPWHALFTEKLIEEGWGYSVAVMAGNTAQMFLLSVTEGVFPDTLSIEGLPNSAPFSPKEAKARLRQTGETPNQY